jgi:hypothetical protein
MNTDVLIVDGNPYSWRRLCELRRQQLEAIAWRSRRCSSFARTIGR